MKRYFDQYAHNRNSKEGDKVQLWDSHHKDKGKHEKFDSLWLGPYEIFEKVVEHTYTLYDGDLYVLPIPYNIIYLKKYFP